MTVFDASAILAILGNEPGRDEATRRLDDGAVVSTVNAGEVIGKLVLRGMAHREAVATLRDLDLAWVAPDDGQAIRVGELGAVRNLSLADRFCIALGEARKEPVVTGDRNWAALSLSVQTDLIR